MILRLAHDVGAVPEYGAADVDCRLLFVGDRYRQLLRLYPEVVHRLSRLGGPSAVAQYLNDSDEIRQFYLITFQEHFAATELQTRLEDPSTVRL